MGGMTCESCSSTSALVRIGYGDEAASYLCLNCASESLRERFPRTRIDPVRFWTYFAKPHESAGVVETHSLPGDSACPLCGLSFTEFTRVGLTGCSECYSAFEAVILPALYEIHTAPGP